MNSTNNYSDAQSRSAGLGILEHVFCCVYKRTKVRSTKAILKLSCCHHPHSGRQLTGKVCNKKSESGDSLYKNKRIRNLLFRAFEEIL